MSLQSVATTISQANQTAVPSPIRRLLTLQPGDRLVWQTDLQKKQVTISPLPKKMGSYLRGLGKQVWQKTNINTYLKQSRADRT